ncbi:hypothetical protein BVX94_01240 [bacterium B17]|nr:hypothetical protein BVX94_01240 [bacterium B17]
MNRSNVLLIHRLAVLVVLLGIVSTGSAKELSYTDLVERMYDMKRLSTKPVPGETGGCFSSWERGARYDEASGKYVNWHANADGRGFMDKNFKMMELEGPGVIWRIWSAKPKKGKLNFYLDGSETPTVAIPFIDMFKTTPYSNYPELAHVKSAGHNFFIPIPFNKSIKIAGEKDWGQYYQITYTKFPKGTTIPSFSGKFSDADLAALKKANDIWGKRGPEQFIGDVEGETMTVTVKPGKEVDVAKYKKAGAIVSITMDRPEMEREASIEILRELAISITWDKDSEPSVWTPLGDFFGTGAGENLHRTLAVGMTKEKYYSNWYMPYKRAKISVRNDGKKPRELTFTIHTEKCKKADDLLRFHSKWHRDDFSGFDKEQLEGERWPDWPVVKIDGVQGRFCGFMAHMWNPNHLWNKECKAKFEKPFPDHPDFKPGGSKFLFYRNEVTRHYWWGEGDEKFFVDGEKMPSTFGTGTEDYFGYAWGTPDAFDSALQTQPRNGGSDEIGKRVNRAGPGNMGHITMARWQIPDDIGFQKSFEATVEKYHPNSWPLLNAYLVSWYQQPGKEDYYKTVPVSERTGYYIPAKLNSSSKKVEGRYEAEDKHEVQLVGKPKERVWFQEMSTWGAGWSGKQLIWMCSGKDQEMTLSFNAMAKRPLQMAFTKAPDYGKFEFYLNGEKIDMEVDLYDSKVVPSGIINLGGKGARKGKHELKIKCIGKNAASKGYLFGLDYIQLDM